MSNMDITAEDDVTGLDCMSDDEKKDEFYLVSKEGDRFLVDRDAAKKMSDLVAASLMDDTNDEATELPMMSVSSETLELVVKFMERMSCQNDLIDEIMKIKKPLGSPDIDVWLPRAKTGASWLKDMIDEWSQDVQTLANLVNASTYMQVRALDVVVGAKIASLVYGAEDADDVRRRLATNAQKAAMQAAVQE